MESTHNHLNRNLASVQEKMIQELVRGREFATQLQLAFHELTGSDHDSATAKDLVTKIMRSFTEAISILSYTESSEVLASSHCQDQCRKGSKRRNMQETWIRITSTPIQDGYAWRKYGQKEIFNTKYLRCYFRCTYKYDQGCEATKQVQRTEDKSPKFWTKYIGYHTCQHDLNQASFIWDSTTAEEGVLLNFESNTITKQEPLLFLSFLPSIKEEHKKPFPSIEQEYKPSSSEYLPPQDDPTKFKSTMPLSALPSTSKLDNADVIVSEGSSSFNIDMELIDSFYFNDLSFDDESF